VNSPFAIKQPKQIKCGFLFGGKANKKTNKNKVQQMAPPATAMRSYLLNSLN
jgi:hypothetical protein